MAYDKKTGTIHIGENDSSKNFEKDLFSHFAHVEKQIAKDFPQVKKPTSKPVQHDLQKRFQSLSKQKRATIVGFVFWTAWVIYRTAGQHEVLGIDLWAWDDREFLTNWLVLPALIGCGFLAFKLVNMDNNTELKTNPISEFETEIQTWPADQAKTALLLIKATLNGDQNKIEELYGDLTVEQLMKVKSVIERLEK